jgi:hypothetical protein
VSLVVAGERRPERVGSMLAWNRDTAIHHQHDSGSNVAIMNSAMKWANRRNDQPRCGTSSSSSSTELQVQMMSVASCIVTRSGAPLVVRWRLPWPPVRTVWPAVVGRPVIAALAGAALDPPDGRIVMTKLLQERVAPDGEPVAPCGSASHESGRSRSAVISLIS